MKYIEVDYTFEPATPENREIVAALLSQQGFDSFCDTKTGLKAYIQTELFSEPEMNETLEPFIPSLEKFHFQVNLVPEQNWNETWEKSFEPVYIGTECCIRAPFHQKPESVMYDIVIEPKMSFGTGHHPTTVLMIEQLLQLTLFEKTVLDMGCGTGVLGILASKMGAKHVCGIDVDEWATTNTTENCQRNNISNFEIYKGDASLLVDKWFDVILANINRNILLNDLEIYVNSMNKNSKLVLSGFYSQDIPIISEKANHLGLNFLLHTEKEQWASVVFYKTNE